MANFFGSEMYQTSGHILAYYGKITAGEFDTIPLLERVLFDKKQLYLPRCHATDPVLEIYPISNLKTELAPGKFGLIEPIPELIVPVNIGMIDLILVPGLVFDRNGGRIGYGKGYYDRLLSTINSTRCITIGLCSTHQVLEQPIPLNSWDIRLDYLITDREIINCCASKNLKKTITKN
jgi:5-formyltetrahydrofolate cyclo-ligase